MEGVQIKLAKSQRMNVHVKVQFVGESAIDEGRPRRELFCLVDRMVSNELMQGDDQNTFLHNMVPLQKNEYHLHRQCVAMALLQGLPGPQVFSRAFNFLERFSAGYCKLVVNVEAEQAVKQSWISL